MRLIALLAFCSFLLAACGFQPLHQRLQGAEGDALRSSLLSNVVVKVEEKTRLHQLYKIGLETAMDPANSRTGNEMGRYVLDASIREILRPIIIERDASITRYDLILQTQFIVIDTQTGETVHRGTRQRISSYNVPESDYARYIAQRDARENGIIALAEMMAMEIALRIDDYE